MRLRADLSLFLVALLWGGAFVAQRLAGQVGSVYFFNAARFALAFFLLLPLLRKRPIKPTAFPWIGLAGSILFLATAFQQAGLKTTTVANAGFITSLYVIFVPLILFLFWKEKPSLLVLVSLVLAFGGAYLLSTGGYFRVRRGDVLELIGAFFWAFHVILLGKVASRYDSLVFSIGQLLVSAVLNLLGGLLWESWTVPQILPWLGAVTYTAVFSLAMGYTLQILAQRHTPPSDAALILCLESVFAALAGWIFLGEALNPLQSFGALLIFCAVLLSQSSAFRVSLHSLRHLSDTHLADE
ncbi:MAG: DMT family transporter [Anaerolineales bacterium]